MYTRDIQDNEDDSSDIDENIEVAINSNFEELVDKIRKIIMFRKSPTKNGIL